MSKTQVDITVAVDDAGDMKLSGIPRDRWEAFDKESRRHFPEAGDNAWAHMISEIIVGATSHNSYVMTDIPTENSQAFDRILQQVGWTQEQFHVYLLRSALIPQALRIVSFSETPQQFGTLIITGIRQSTFQKIEAVAKVDLEHFFGILIDGAESGQMTLTPEDMFVKIFSDRSGRDPNQRSE